MVTASAVAQWKEQGYLVVREVFDASSIVGLKSEAERLLGRTELIHGNNLRCRWADHVDTGECRFDCFDPVIDLSPACAQAARAPQLLAILEQLYGEPALLFKDKLIYKPPGAPGYPLHQDYIDWAEFPKSFMTVILALDASDPGNGATQVFRGYHQRGDMSPRDGSFYRLPEDAVDPAQGEYLNLQPGDIAVFSGYTPHRSEPNRSSGWRRLLYLSYNAASDGGDLRASHYEQFHAWLRERYAEHRKFGVYFR